MEHRSWIRKKISTFTFMPAHWQTRLNISSIFFFFFLTGWLSNLQQNSYNTSRFLQNGELISNTTKKLIISQFSSPLNSDFTTINCSWTRRTRVSSLIRNPQLEIILCDMEVKKNPRITCQNEGCSIRKTKKEEKQKQGLVGAWIEVAKRVDGFGLCNF